MTNDVKNNNYIYLMIFIVIIAGPSACTDDNLEDIDVGLWHGVPNGNFEVGEGDIPAGWVKLNVPSSDAHVKWKSIGVNKVIEMTNSGTSDRRCDMALVSTPIKSVPGSEIALKMKVKLQDIAPGYRGYKPILFRILFYIDDDEHYDEKVDIQPWYTENIDYSNSNPPADIGNINGGTSDWITVVSKYTRLLDDAERIAFTIKLQGTGILWLDDLECKITEATQTQGRFSIDFDTPFFDWGIGHFVLSGPNMLSFSTECAYAGTHALRIMEVSGETKPDEKVISFSKPYSNIHVRCYLRLSPSYISDKVGDYNNVLMIRVFETGNNTYQHLRLQKIDESERWSLGLQYVSDKAHNAGTLQEPDLLSPNRWYCVEFAHIQDSVAGGARLWLDGDLKIDSTNHDTSGIAFQALYFGTCVKKPSIQGTFYIDNIVVSDSYIGP